MSEPGQRRIDEIGDESRRRILDAAEELFAERGYDRTSFVDISARSGISRGSIPWHFKNKDGLVIAVLERSIKRAVSRERYADLPSLPSLGTVLADYAHYLHESNPRLHFMILTEAMNGTGSLHEQYRAFQQKQRADLQDWFRAQRPEVSDRAAATAREESLATVINAGLIGIQLQWQVDPEGVDLEEALATLARLIDNGMAHLWDGLTDSSAKSTRKSTGAKKAPRKAKPA